MFEILVLIAFVWLVFKFIGLAFKVSWCLAKVVATILCVLAIPGIIICLLAAGGILLLLPLLAIVGAISLLRAC